MGKLTTQTMLTGGGAFVVGVLLGGLIFGGDDGREALQARLDRMSTKVAEGTDALGAKVAALGDEVSASSGAAADAVTREISGIQSQLETLPELRAQLSALHERVMRLSEQSAPQPLSADAVSAAMDKSFDAAIAPRLALIEGKLGEIASARPTAPTQPGTAQAEPAQPETAQAEADAPDENLLTLNVGETARIGEQRFFLSRMQGGSPSAWLFAPGGASARIGAEPVAFNGCMVSLRGIRGGQARIDANCDAQAAEFSAEAFTPIGLKVGESAKLGEGRLFLSRVDAEAGAAWVALAGEAGQGVREITATPVEIGGCAVAFTGVKEGVSQLLTDCGDAQAAETPAAPAPVEAETLAQWKGELAPVALRVGQSASLGETKLFLSRIGDDAAWVSLAGTAGQKARRVGAEPVELAGCRVAFGGAADGAATLLTGCE